MSLSGLSQVPASRILAVRPAHAGSTEPSSEKRGEKTADITRHLWPASVSRQSPVLALQILAVWSVDASTEAPSGEKTADLIPLLWPASARRHSPVLALQILAF